MAECYDMGAGTFSLEGYDGVTTYGPIETGQDYDVGQTGGQFAIVVTTDHVAAFEALSESDKTAVWAAQEQFLYTYFNWYDAQANSDALIGEIGDGYGLEYTLDSVVTHYYFDQPAADSGVATVTFDSYPAKGWMGWCTVPNCDGETATGIVTGYAYDTGYYYFVFYATSDLVSGVDGDGNLIF